MSESKPQLFCEHVVIHLEPSVRNAIKNICERHPDRWPNESAAGRAAFTVWFRWLRKQGIYLSDTE